MVLVSVAVGILVLLLGLYFAFNGLKVARVFIPILVGLLGFAIMVRAFSDAGASPLVAYGIAIPTGLVMAFAGYFLYKLGIILQFASFGFLLTLALMGMLNIHIPVLAIMIGVLFAVAFGAFAIFTRIWNYLIVIGSALNGAAIALMGLLIMFVGHDKMDHLLHDIHVKHDLNEWVAALFLLVFLFVSIGGMVHQIKDVGGLKKVKDFDMSYAGTFDIDVEE